ncbi:hypothetical protein HBI56_105940 [Parastagonospora nodorum]|nr:hypothetical protein HBH53_087910 [Parastagonospora nodorum]KAH3977932.1 hypothetical protein HBH51_067970 [Parastagonospora nodorum]KAH3995882.1 hypothetical protein HBI10_164780 [Parastagonospora nodorum]KAH4021675.1 hypothetical protein HBI13_106030 [Parastagonospora nodorum]KAH4030423.1 hypothetical protein HBI09_129500 [Parastagonospora nodorum]
MTVAIDLELLRAQNTANLPRQRVKAPNGKSDPDGCFNQEVWRRRLQPGVRIRKLSLFIGYVMRKTTLPRKHVVFSKHCKEESRDVINDKVHEQLLHLCNSQSRSNIQKFDVILKLYRS